MLKMFLVIGGWTGSNYIDSSEIFDPDQEYWRAGGALPSPMTFPRATTIDNRVFLFGMNNQNILCVKVIIMV